MLVVGSVVIRVRDLRAQLAFWSAALDSVPREPIDDDFALLRPRSGEGPNVSLDAAPSERVLPPRIHLDLYADDQAAEVARLEGLGAVVVPWDGRPDDADYVIPGNDDAIRSCSLIIRAIANGIEAGKQKVTPAEMTAPTNGQPEEKAQEPAAEAAPAEPAAEAAATESAATEPVAEEVPAE